MAAIAKAPHNGALHFSFCLTWKEKINRERNITSAPRVKAKRTESKIPDTMVKAFSPLM